MNCSNFDDTYINYLLDNRVMRRTQNAGIYEEYFSILYNRWIVKFLNANGIQVAPLLLLCNTLSKWPDYFSFCGRSFFVIDNYLYDFLYDWNYILAFDSLREYEVNLYIKLYTESSYINRNYDICYFLCYSSPNIEQFKNEHYYENLKKPLLEEECEVQLAFSLLHEATHFLISKDCGQILQSELYIQQSEILDLLVDAKSTVNQLNDLNSDQKNLLIEECSCDSLAITFILESDLTFHSLTKIQVFDSLMQSILYNYIIAYSEVCQSIDSEHIDEYFDSSLWSIVFRIGNAYNTILRYSIKHDIEASANTLVEWYDTWQSSALRIMQDIRKVSKYIKEHIDSNFDTTHINSTSFGERLQYIKQYLLLA